MGVFVLDYKLHKEKIPEESCFKEIIMKLVNCSTRTCTNEVQVPETFEFVGCCSGHGCGCLGLEINPVFCEQCHQKLFEESEIQNES